MRYANLFSMFLGIAAASLISFSTTPAIETASSDDESAAHAIDLYNQAVNALNNEQYREARGLLAQANDAKPDDPKILMLFGYAQRHTGDLDRARENLETAVELEPALFKARQILGEVHLKLAEKQLKTLREHQGVAWDNYQLLIRAFIEIGVQATDDLDHEYEPDREFSPY